MLQSPPPKPSPRGPDFKARFGVDQNTTPASRLASRSGNGPAKLTRLQARRQKRSRFTFGAVLFSLMLGIVGSAAFFVGTDVEAISKLIKTSIAPSASEPKMAEVPESESEPPAEPISNLPPVKTAEPPPDGIAKTITTESPVLLPEPEPVVDVPPVAVEPRVAAAPATEIVLESETVEAANSLAAAAPDVAESVVPETVVPATAEPAAVAVAAPVVVLPDAPLALVPGQVFRDCENCPDVVVVVPPRRTSDGTEVLVTRQVVSPDLPPFAIGRFEVTFDDWGRCMAGGGCSDIPDDAGWGRNARPVINVSHEMATAQYLKWISQVTGKAYRLPTAEEWDTAEAGAGVVPAGVVQLDPQTACKSGNYANGPASAGDVACIDGYPSTAPAGSLKANSLGVFDMRGNVWEWVSDCWSPGFKYKPKPSEQDCHKRLLRGGSWSSRPLLSATPARGFENASRATKTIGFRVARTLP